MRPVFHGTRLAPCKCRAKASGIGQDKQRGPGGGRRKARDGTYEARGDSARTRAMYIAAIWLRIQRRGPDEVARETWPTTAPCTTNMVARDMNHARHVPGGETGIAGQVVPDPKGDVDCAALDPRLDIRTQELSDPEYLIASRGATSPPVFYLTSRLRTTTKGFRGAYSTLLTPLRIPASRRRAARGPRYLPFAQPTRRITSGLTAHNLRLLPRPIQYTSQKLL